MTAEHELPEEHEQPGAEVVELPHHAGHAIERKVAGQSAIDLIRETIAPDLNDGELALFVEVANRAGLDPFTRQIHAVKRGGRMVIQTGIDGLRLIARRTGEYAGREGPYFADASGSWRMMPDGRPLPWLDASPPAAAMVGARRRGDEVTTWGVATWQEYGEGNRNLWLTIPATMLAKVAEAHALRATFPAETSGLYTDDELDQADRGRATTAVTRPPANRATGTGGAIDPWNAKPRDVRDALVAAKLPVGGNVDELRQRLADHYAAEAGVIDVPAEADSDAQDGPEEAATAEHPPEEPAGQETPQEPPVVVRYCAADECDADLDETGSVVTPDGDYCPDHAPL